MPKFSIIICAYNAAKTLAEAIASVHKQTFLDWELILVNDGSIDETEQIFANETADFSEKAICINQQNQGLGKARNVGAKAASGEWLAFLDADDSWAPQKLAQLNQQILAHKNIDLFYHGIFECYPNDLLRKRKFWRVESIDDLIEKGNPIVPSAVAIKKSVFQKCGGFETNRNLVDDLGLWLRLLSSNTKMLGFPKALTRYKMGEGMSHQLDDYHHKIVATIEDAQENGLISQTQKENFIQRKNYEYARQMHKFGEWKKAKEYYSKSKSRGLKIAFLAWMLKLHITM